MNGVSENTTFLATILKCTSTDTLFFQNREAQSEMPQEAAVQAGCTNRSTTLMSLSQIETWILSA